MKFDFIIFILAGITVFLLVLCIKRSDELYKKMPLIVFIPVDLRGERAGRTELEGAMAGAEDNSIFFIFFRCDRSGIYQSDYRLIYEVINHAKSGHTGVYSAEYELVGGK